MSISQGVRRSQEECLKDELLVRFILQVSGSISIEDLKEPINRTSHIRVHFDRTHAESMVNRLCDTSFSAALKVYLELSDTTFDNLMSRSAGIS